VSSGPIAQDCTRTRADSQMGGLQIIDLRRLKARDLDLMLREQTAEWRLKLDWNCSRSADLLREFADSSALTGAALLAGGEVVGYGYTGLEENKARICDVYVRPGWRGGNAETVLFRLLLGALTGISSVRRVESQLMLVENTLADALQRERIVRLFERHLMTREASIPLPPGRASTNPGFRFEPWCDRHCDQAAAVLSLAYTGHIDSQINEQYRTFTGAIRYLYDLVQFPGSATFCRSASYVAFVMATGQVVGISLASFVADDVAHITELCVTPRVRGAGLGYELLRRSAEALRDAGANRISLAVTGANEGAVRLYMRCGFCELHRFHAYVWERQETDRGANG
jgi:ribosomal protein S18 acetylase RimI-like enzyme